MCVCVCECVCVCVCVCVCAVLRVIVLFCKCACVPVSESTMCVVCAYIPHTYQQLLSFVTRNNNYVANPQYSIEQSIGYVSSQKV